MSLSVTGRLERLVYKFWALIQLMVMSISVNVFLFTLLPILLIPVLIYRAIVRQCAVLFCPHLSHMLRGQTFMLFKRAVNLEPGMNIILAFRVKSKASLDFERVKLLIAQRLLYAKITTSEVVDLSDGGKFGLAYPELQQFCVRWGGYFFWTHEQNFSIDEHVKLKMVGPDETPTEVHKSFLHEALPEHKSPWQILIVENSAVGEFHMFFKFHHSLADGYSSIRALMRCTDSPDPEALLPQTGMPTPPPTLKSEVWHHITYPFRVALEFARIPTRENPHLPWNQTAWKPFPDPDDLYHNLVLENQPMDMIRLKAIAKQHEVSVNAVVHATLTGALRSYLLSKYPPNMIPDCVSFYQPIPVGHHPSGLCNTFRVVTYQLPIGEPDPISRLVFCHQMLAEGKQSLQSHVMYLLLEAFSKFPATFPFQQMIERLWPVQEVLVTNMPGPLGPMTFDGQEVVGMNILLLEPPSRFYISLLSCNGCIEFGCSGDRRVLGHDDVAVMGRLFTEEFALIETLNPKNV